MKKKLVTLDNNETLEDKPRKKPNTDYFTGKQISCFYTKIENLFQ